MHVTNFFEQNRQKNILKGVNFTNLKTLGGYIAKSKSQEVYLQLTQTPIWPSKNYNLIKFHIF